LGIFKLIGGIPKIARTDRMGALGRSQGKRFVLHPATLDFCSHHGLEIKACQARDAKRKGKVERPFFGLDASFLEELAILGPPTSLAELNALSQAFPGSPGQHEGASGQKMHSCRSVCRQERQFLAYSSHAPL